MDKETNKIIKNIMIPIIIALSVDFYFRIVNLGIEQILYLNSTSVVFSILITYIIILIFFAITKKTSKSVLIYSSIIIIVLIINQVKIEYTSEPILMTDLNFSNQINRITQMVGNTLPKVLLNQIIIYVPLFIIFILIYIWSKRNEIKIEKKKSRIILVLINVVFLIALFIPNEITQKIYLKIFLGTEQHKDYASYTTNLNYYCENGVLTGMYGVILNNRFSEPDGYNKEEVENTIENANTEIKSNIGKPNIIVMFSESFWDVKKIDEIVFDKNPSSNFDNLKNAGILINTLSCSYGGMSENVAFELLTGGSMNYFNTGYIPIMSLYQKDNSDKIPSIVKVLKENNYYSKIVFGKDYYNSEKAYLKMGFDEYEEYEENENNIKGTNISDEYIIDNIIKELENKEEGNKIFYLAETIQNHMPYNKEKYEEYNINIEQSKLGSEETETILSYAQGIYDADKQLGRLYDFIKNYEEPTILVFLGDHLPYLYGDTNKNVLEKINYFNTDDEKLNTYRKYNTQTLILNNYNMEIEDIYNNLSNDMVLTYLINQMDINNDNYYKWLYTTIKKLPASNKQISLDINGNLYNTLEIQGDMKDIYNYKEKIQYNRFIENLK